MTRRFTTVLVLLLLAAVPVSARVISYAPYTNRVAEPGYHERTSRHFVLIERTDERSFPPFGQVVLYDTQGGEPRVVFPQHGAGDYIQNVLLYERKNTADAPPMLLVQAGTGAGEQTWFSNDGGSTWKQIQALRNLGVRVETYGVDFGGPWTKGIGSTSRLGTDQWPFVVSGPGTWAISATGEAKQLASRSLGGVLIGQNAEGTQFLLHGDGDFNERSRISTVDLNGTVTKIVSGWFRGTTAGWIAPDGSVYLQLTRWEGRFLFHYRNGTMQFVRGPEGVTPPDPLSDYTGVNGPEEAFFAVPTADFSGAWLLQRAAGKPTRLARHTAARGIEEMWSDVTMPEVEALIAGKSGDKLLVQVHRERPDLGGERLFVDPALAVWKVGDPAPRDYDELYLNEERNKGFIHVDVDRLRDGTPFVFNAGSFESGGSEGPTSPPTGGGGDVIQEWGVVRASLKQHLVLPGVARLRGAFNSNWLTDVTLYNPMDTPQDVEVQFTATGETMQAATTRKIQLTLKPYEIRFIPDVLHALFAIEDGGGALHFLPASSINVTGRTYDVKADGGTFGFGMQAIDSMNAAGPRFPVTFSGALPGVNFRTNILLTDTSGRGTEVGANAFGILGGLGSGAPLVAPAGGINQYNNVGQTLGVFGHEAAGLVVQPTRGTAIATVVAMDNRTNDPTYFPPDLSARTPRFIPVIGHLDGAHGSHFRSDLYFLNPVNETRTVEIEIKDWSSSLRYRRRFTLLPGEGRIIHDALMTMFGIEGLARLRYITLEGGEGVRITSRTYTVDESGATYGTLIPPLNNFQIAAAGDALEIIGAGGGEGFRTNLGLVELNADENGDGTRVRIRLYGSERTSHHSFIVELPRGGGMQINDIFTARGIPTPTAALIVIEVLDAGMVGAYATLTDNKTNDTTYLGAHFAGRE